MYCPKGKHNLVFTEALPILATDVYSPIYQWRS